MPRNMLPFIIILPSLLYSLISLLSAVKYFKGDGARGKGQKKVFDLPCLPGVTILKPVKGLDADSYDNFVSFCRQQYEGPLQLLFAVASADDQIITVIRQLIADFPGHDIGLTINPSIHG
ncbi:MAG: ceramide glucosyltransferase, partial [Desulfuromonadaceae bacterium]|nr:ceramide glucosyltransferase [Desulfuromonadaceae bacterium]